MSIATGLERWEEIKNTWNSGRVQCDE